MKEEIKQERKVIIKRHSKLQKEIKQNAFFDLASLGNCTICKLSIALLIIMSFIVVKPQPQTKYDKVIQQDSLISSKKDTVRNVNIMGLSPTGLISSSDQQ